METKLKTFLLGCLSDSEDSLKFTELYLELEDLVLDYAKHNAETCLKHFKETGSCVTDSRIRFNRWNNGQ